MAKAATDTDVCATCGYKGEPYFIAADCPHRTGAGFIENGWPCTNCDTRPGGAALRLSEHVGYDNPDHVIERASAEA